MEDTCIIFTADHGYCLGEHNWHGKNSAPIYEEIGHIPLLIHLPKQTKGRRIKAVAQPCDLAPTILDFAGRKAPKTVTGMSLRGVMEGKARATRPFAFSRRCSMPGVKTDSAKRVTISGQGWALVFPKEGPRAAKVRFEMYDLKADPLQAKNVLKKNLRQARKMWDAYVAWLKEVKAPENLHVPERP
jgi:arylsulfatase A-like enzyme